MTDRRVLVTGGTGYIGRWAARTLLDRGYEVHVPTSRSAEPMPDELRGAAIHRTDLLVPGAPQRLIAEIRPTHLMHFAWNVAPGIYWTSPDNFRWVAASAELLLAFHAAGGRRAVMAGSGAEYDWEQAGICDEWATPLAAGGTPYAVCKVALQKMLASYGRQAGLSTAWGRIFFHYGPYEHPDRLIASVIRNLLTGKEAPCSHGRQVRNFIHVAEVGEAFAALLDSAVEGPVNIGSDDRMTIADIVGLVGRQTGRPELVRLGARPARPDEPALLAPAVSRLYQEVGWRPRHTIETGLADTIAWWRRELA